MKTQTAIQAAGKTKGQTKAQPDVLELTRLAATLGQGRPINESNAGELARQALLLFQACRKHLDDSAERAKIISDFVREDEERFGGIRTPAKWPATLADFLRLVVGGKRKSDRLVTYRDFLGHLLRVDRWLALPNHREIDFDTIPTPSLVEIGLVVEREEIEGFTESTYHQRATAFVDWRKKLGKKTRHERAKTAAQAKNDKIKAAKLAKVGQNSLTPPEGDKTASKQSKGRT